VYTWTILLQASLARRIFRIAAQLPSLCGFLYPYFDCRLLSAECQTRIVFFRVSSLWSLFYNDPLGLSLSFHRPIRNSRAVIFWAFYSVVSALFCCSGCPQIVSAIWATHLVVSSAVIKWSCALCWRVTVWWWQFVFVVDKHSFWCFVTKEHNGRRR